MNHDLNLEDQSPRKTESEEIELDHYPTQSAPDEMPQTVRLNQSFLFGLLIPLVFLLGLGFGYWFWGRTAASQTALDIARVETAANQALQAAQEARSLAAQFANAQAAVSAATGSSSSPNSGEGTPNTQTTQPTAAAANNPEPTETPAETRSVVRYDVPVDDDPVIGAEDAVITIIEFSDYECPFCTKWHEEVFPKILAEYPTQVRIVYRDFPLENIHPNAIPAAEAANCAFEQGKFWEYHDLLFSGGKSLNRTTYMAYASQLNLNLETFADCLSSNKYEQEVLGDFEFAANLGVRSTPTFFINGIALVGAQPYEVFKQIIDGELNGEFE